MRVIFLLLTAATVMFSQTPDPASDEFVAQVRTHTPHWLARVRAQHPDATVEEITEHAIRWRRRDGKRVSVFGAGVGYVDPDTQELSVRDLRLWETDKGYAVKGAGVRARIAHRPELGKSDVGLFSKLDGDWAGFAIRVPTVSLAPDTGEGFVFAAGVLRIRLHHGGFDLFTSPIPAARGAKVYSFPYRTRGLSLSESPDGSLSGGSGWSLSRAEMVGADGQRYACEPWRIVSQEIGFSCDDSVLPASSFPYIIDPSGTYYVSASSDDQHVWGATQNQYPPNCTAPGSSSGTNMDINNSKSGTEYKIVVGGIRFNTASLPDNAIINSASITLYVEFDSSNDNRDFVGEWYASSNWPFDSCSDWTSSIGNNAHAGSAINGEVDGYSWNTFTLSNLSNISKTSYTGTRWGVGGGQPTGGNFLNVQTVDSAYDPYMSVTYTLPTSAVVSVIETDD